MSPSPDERTLPTADRADRWILALLVIAFATIATYLLRYVLLPFAVAGGMAFVCMPVVRGLQSRLNAPRWLASLAPFLVLLGLLALLGFGVKVYVLADVVDLLSRLDVQMERFLATLLRGRTIAVRGHFYGPHEMTQALLGGAGALFDPSQVAKAVGLAFGAIMGGILTLVLLLYFLMDGPRIARGTLWIIPPALRPKVMRVAQQAGPIIFRYVQGIIVITAYATAFTWLVTRFVLHLPSALVLAIAVGLLEMVPLLGPILSVTLIGLVAIEQVTFAQIVGVALYCTLLRVSIDQFVGPLVLGKAMRLPPPLIIFAFLAGGAIWGILGVLVAIPAAAVGKVVLEEAYAERGGQRL